jgi:hypothetical protein
LNWSSLDSTDVGERLPILYAVYTPPGDTLPLYRSITPVNTFRVLLDHYFGTNLGLLDDREYYTTWNRPYRYYDVTSEVLGSDSVGGESND